MSTMCEHSSFVRKCMHEKKNARGNWRIMGQIRLICEVNYTCITCTMMFANSFHKQMYMGQTTRLKPAWRGQRCIAHRQILREKGCFQPTSGNLAGQPWTYCNLFVMSGRVNLGESLFFSIDTYQQHCRFSFCDLLPRWVELSGKP